MYVMCSYKCSRKQQQKQLQAAASVLVRSRLEEQINQEWEMILPSASQTKYCFTSVGQN